MGQQQYFNCWNFSIGPMSARQQWRVANNDVLPTMTCCQQLQPLPNVGPTIACYLGHVTCIFANNYWFCINILYTVSHLINKNGFAKNFSLKDTIGKYVIYIIEVFNINDISFIHRAVGKEVCIDSRALTFTWESRRHVCTPHRTFEILTIPIESKADCIEVL